MKRTVIALFTVLATLAFAIPAVARESATQDFPISGTDPCSGQRWTGTIHAVIYTEETFGATVTKQHRTLTATTATGTTYTGRGEATIVTNENVVVSSLHDMLVSDAGARVRIGATIVLDRSTTPPTVKLRNVDRVCVHA
jgi:hypothetical protein